MSIETVGNILTETKEVANMTYNPMIITLKNFP